MSTSRIALTNRNRSKQFSCSQEGWWLVLPILALFLTVPSLPARGAPEPRIDWDSSTLVQIHGNGGRYGRIARIDDDHLIAAFVENNGVGGTVSAKHSYDNGRTWANAQGVAFDPNDFTANAEITRLSDGRLIFSYGNRTDFGIWVAFSTNDGQTWAGHRQVYGGGEMWEPNVVEMPDGALHLYFANEKPFTSSNDQSIDRIVSLDGGHTWSDPERISYRPNYRDGMPVTEILNDGNLVVIIEDGGWDNRRLKPTILDVADTPTQGSVIGPNDPRRWKAHAGGEPLPSYINAGAPYLQQLVGGTTLLSYQARDTRLPEGERIRRMGVAVGNEKARDFGADTQPFAGLADPNVEQTWPSIFDKNALTITAMANTRVNGNGGLWAIDGHVHTEILGYDASNADKSGASAWADLFEHGGSASDWDWLLDSNNISRVAVDSEVPGITAAYRFAGNGGAEMPSFDQLGDASNDDATFEMWFKPDTLTDDKATLFETGGSIIGTSLTLFADELAFRIDDDDSLQSDTGEPLDGIVLQKNINQRISTNEFNHLIARVANVGLESSPATLSLYLNGSLLGSTDVWGLDDWSGGNMSGLGNAGHDDNWDGATLASDAFQGEIARFNFYDRALLDEEISLLAADGVVTFESADFDEDGDVDGADFLRWQHGFGTLSGATLQQGDANGDNAVNEIDLAIWKSQYAASASGASSSAAVPEPGGWILSLFGVTGLLSINVRRIRK